ncbi:MAG: hypothetical protein ABIT37_10920 [Luteolibacter sp.]
MKLSLLIPPAVALVLVGAWNVSQMRSISSLEEERVTLRKRIAMAMGSSGVGLMLATRPSKSGKTGTDRIDWKSLSEQLASAQEGGSASEMRAMMNFQQRLEKMTKDEMVDALDEIASLNLSDAARAMLESMIIDPLIAQDPELALKHFADRIQSDPDGIGWQLSNALKQWAKTDLSAATAWFDKQIADGNFESKTLDGRSDMRLQFEGALMESLLASDPAAAARRLSELPEDQRREVLQQMPFGELSEESRNAYTDLVRKLVPADEREGSFAHIATELVGNGDYSDVSAFLDGVHATPSERAAAAMDAANSKLEQIAMEGKVTVENVDELRDWLKLQAPGQIDSITGKALAEAAQERGKFKFSDAAQLAMAYHQSSGNDDVLVAFLESYSARSNLDEAKQLAEMIKDDARRKEILKGLK